MSSLEEPAARLQSVAAGQDRRAELLHPCVPLAPAGLAFPRETAGSGFGGFAKDEQKLRHERFSRRFRSTRAEACPPPCVNTTNKLQPFGHRSIYFCKCMPRSLPPLPIEWREPGGHAMTAGFSTYLPGLTAPTVPAARAHLKCPMARHRQYTSPYNPGTRATRSGP